MLVAKETSGDYLTASVAAAVITALIHVDALRSGLIQLEASRTHALEAAQRVNALGGGQTSSRLFHALVDICTKHQRSQKMSSSRLPRHFLTGKQPPAYSPMHLSLDCEYPLGQVHL